MSVRTEYMPGQLINGIVFIKEIDPHTYPRGDVKRRAIFVCGFCGNSFQSVIGSVKSGLTTSCGCFFKNQPGRKTHGLKNHPLYNRWKSIKVRCYYKGSKSYKDYGGRGIVMCDEWKNDFKSFFDYITRLPGYDKPGLTIDRIDNSGNYEPGNVRWATWKQQANNRIRHE